MWRSVASSASRISRCTSGSAGRREWAAERAALLVHEEALVRVREGVERGLAERCLGAGEELASGSEAEAPVQAGERVERAALAAADVDRPPHAAGAGTARQRWARVPA